MCEGLKCLTQLRPQAFSSGAKLLENFARAKVKPVGRVKVAHVVGTDLPSKVEQGSLRDIIVREHMSNLEQPPLGTGSGANFAGGGFDGQR